MEIINEFKLEFLSKSSNEAFARVVAAAFVSQLDPTLEEIADIKTAVSEAVTNAVIHGYEGNKGMVKMSCVLYESAVDILVTDEGRGIEDVEKARQPMYTSKPDLERSGMGFTIMENFMDKLEILSQPGKGTTVKMSKTLGIQKK
jgi:stage II sporulation protein AB (anti-sigma F factor)